MQDYEPPSGELLSAIEKQLGGLEKLKGKMNADAAAIQVRLILVYQSQTSFQESLSRR